MVDLHLILIICENSLSALSGDVTKEADWTIYFAHPLSLVANQDKKLKYQTTLSAIYIA